MSVGHVCNQFWDFPKISSFTKIRNLNLSGNSSGNSYIQFLMVLMSLRSTCGEEKLFLKVK